MNSKLWVLLPALWLQPVNAGVTDRYALPRNKVKIRSCQEAALELHPGMIDDLRILPQPKTFWIRYEIIMRGGAEWSVVCDLADGQILGDQALDVNPEPKTVR